MTDTTQHPSLFDGRGDDEGPTKDTRLASLLKRVYGVMSDGHWRTLSDIAHEARAGSEASVSARLRDLRKPRFGGHTIERQLVGDGLYAYRMVPSECGLLDGGDGARSLKPEARRVLREWLASGHRFAGDEVRWAVGEMLR